MMDPTALWDGMAEEMRRWYEANRESWRDRWHWTHPTKSGGLADNFMLAFLSEVSRTFARHGYSPNQDVAKQERWLIANYLDDESDRLHRMDRNSSAAKVLCICAAAVRLNKYPTQHNAHGEQDE